MPPLPRSSQDAAWLLILQRAAIKMEPQQEVQAQQQQQQAPAPSTTALDMNPSAFVDDLHNAVGGPVVGSGNDSPVGESRN